jgi:hypothetical protein
MHRLLLRKIKLNIKLGKHKGEKKEKRSWGPVVVVHSCNPVYSGDRDRRNMV